MATIELRESDKIASALRILVHEWGWGHGGVVIYSPDERMVRFREWGCGLALKTTLKTTLMNHPDIGKLEVSFRRDVGSRYELINIARRLLKVSQATFSSVYATLFVNAVYDAFNQLFPGNALMPFADEESFVIEYRAFDLYELSEDVADVLHSFKEAVLNNYQRSLQKYLNECEECV